MAGEIDDKADEGALDEAFGAVLDKVYGTEDRCCASTQPQADSHNPHNESSWPTIQLSDAAAVTPSTPSRPSDTASHFNATTPQESTVSAVPDELLTPGLGTFKLPSELLTPGLGTFKSPSELSTPGLGTLKSPSELSTIKRKIRRFRSKEQR